MFGIAAGENNSLALDGDGRVWEWGTGYEGDLNNPRAAQEAHLPRLVTGLPRARLIASSGSSSLAVTDSGLWTWGVVDDYKYWRSEVPPL
jgi:alpha-tubulin suppressor-like RCC1 family protein